MSVTVTSARRADQSRWRVASVIRSVLPFFHKNSPFYWALEWSDAITIRFTATWSHFQIEADQNKSTHLAKYLEGWLWNMSIIF